MRSPIALKAYFNQLYKYKGQPFCSNTSTLILNKGSMGSMVDIEWKQTRSLCLAYDGSFEAEILPESTWAHWCEGLFAHRIAMSELFDASSSPRTDCNTWDRAIPQSLDGSHIATVQRHRGPYFEADGGGR